MTMKPCQKCHSTEHLRIGIIDDHSSASRSVKAECTECHTFVQIDYVPTGPFANERRPGDAQLVREVRYYCRRCDSTVIFLKKCEPEGVCHD